MKQGSHEILADHPVFPLKISGLVYRQLKGVERAITQWRGLEEPAHQTFEL
jgi:hypothetical protein